ncbi:RsfA family transcriptional regulator [Sutcliffiella rhizosphaerae]|uniref:Prespore-specific transcriptional regulator RsfA n=1 Tax=Sutcliffiella rhizosphaerae TaxID=2880967 RepID=A0ABM8YJL7_9BACI|nr:RsfA family transcriptional regulator [Sutcliffiella rhizosphaerae]CAG9620081.1 Prespore-specific transcriptional regulator RsfA [Sutcliffiella rhizosphaerae]
MKDRQDAWSEENDLLLAETVLRHVREGSTQLNAFDEVGDKLNRTSAACGFRWNAVVRHDYEKALQLAKKQRKQRQRALGQPTKKLLYTPPETIVDEELPLILDNPISEERQTISVPKTRVERKAATYGMRNNSDLSLEQVISFLQTMKHSNAHSTALQHENERLVKENEGLARTNKELEVRVQKLQEEQITVQEDYETLMKIMNRARKLVLFDEEEHVPSKFMMDRNGNLEKLAE